MNTYRSTWQPAHTSAASFTVSGSHVTSPVNGTLRTVQLLQRKYRAALSGAVVAKARYLAHAGEAFSTAISIERARWRWQRIEGCRARLAAEISLLTDAAESTERPVQRELRV